MAPCNLSRQGFPSPGRLQGQILARSWLTWFQQSRRSLSRAEQVQVPNSNPSWVYSIRSIRGLSPQDPGGRKKVCHVALCGQPPVGWQPVRLRPEVCGCEALRQDCVAFFADSQHAWTLREPLADRTTSRQSHWPHSMPQESAAEPNTEILRTLIETVHPVDLSIERSASRSQSLRWILLVRRMTSNIPINHRA